MKASTFSTRVTASHTAKDGTRTRAACGLDGRQAVAIDQTGGGGDVTAYVAVEDPHYLLKLEQAEDEGVFTFSRFDEEFAVAAPPEDQTYTP